MLNAQQRARIQQQMREYEGVAPLDTDEAMYDMDTISAAIGHHDNEAPPFRVSYLMRTYNKICAGREFFTPRVVQHWHNEYA